MKVAVLLFDGVDLLDVGGPYEVFLTASRLARRRGDPAPFDVVVVSATDRPVQAYGGLTVGPSAALSSARGCDLVVVPGAIDIDRVMADPQVHEAVRLLAAEAVLTASVCTGAFLLADAGLLDGRDFTTHWEDLPALTHRLGADPARARQATWVDAGAVVTAGGLSAGIAMALHLVHRLAGEDLALASARQLDYAFDPAST